MGKKRGLVHIELFAQVTVDELVERICNQASIHDIVKLVAAIDDHFCDWELTERLIEHFMEKKKMLDEERAT